jgi:hypothetical protein
MFRFLLALYILSYWPHITWKHVIWAGVIAIMTYPLKKIWDWWLEEFWTAFWLSFKAGFKQTPGGQEFLKAYHEARAKKDAQIAKEHPELEPLLHCKKCQGKGCEDCGGTGWV